MSEVYLSLSKEGFESTKKRAETEYNDDCSEESEYGGLKWKNCEIVGETFEYKDGEFEVYGDLTDTDSGKSLGYLSLKTKLDLDTIIDFIEFYMKKLGKLKTVLEATK